MIGSGLMMSKNSAACVCVGCIIAMSATLARGRGASAPTPPVPAAVPPPQSASPVPAPTRRMGTPVLALVSPDVLPDRRVTLRFRAREATSVQLVGEITQGVGRSR